MNLKNMLATSVCILSLAGTHFALGVETGQGDPGGFAARMKDWQDEMSQAFHDTWKGLWQDKDAKSLNASSIAAASMDMREEQGCYIVRLNLPGRDLNEVGVSIIADMLHIVAPAEGGANRYEQDVKLPGIAAGAKPDIQRIQDENLVVITVPKGETASAGQPPAVAETDSADQWDREVLDQMSRMQREMNRIFDDSFANLHDAPDYGEFFDEPSFGSSLDLQEKGDGYVVRAYLPDRNMSNVKVSVEGETLKLEAQAENTQDTRNGGGVFSRKSSYSQLITLPGPVKADKMEVQRKDNMLVVTLPKA